MYSLGISLSHDSGVSLIENGHIKLAVSEERFCREKSYSGLPKKSLEWIIKELGGNLKDISHVGVANRVQGAPPPILSDLSDAEMPWWQWTLLKTGMTLGLDRLVLGTETGVRCYQEVFRHLSGKPFQELLQLLGEAGCTSKIRCYDHHVCHLLSSIQTSGWNECLSISTDCFGDAVGGRVGIFSQSRMDLIAMTPMFHSIGYYYLFATNVCGFPKGYHCGKTTGLAAYAKGGAATEYFRHRITFNPKTGSIVNHGKFLYSALQEMRKELKPFSREEIAAAIQEVTEEVITAYIKFWLQKSKQTRLALSGGIFANVKLNQRIAALPEVKELFVHPHMGDGGLCTGAAYAAIRDQRPQSEWPVSYRLPHAFLGPDLDTAAIPTLLQEKGLKFHKPKDIDLEVAQLLADGKVVARVAGRMEYGPRALGNRSILYQATDPTVNTWLNHKLCRSEFMPFAPMLLAEDADQYLLNYSNQTAHAAEFMTVTYDVTERCKKEAPAVVHVDGTARPQIIEANVNPHCHAIILHYKKLTGLSVIINTSYNMHDEPIVCTAEEAIRAFLLSQLDILILEDYIVQKNPERT